VSGVSKRFALENLMKDLPPAGSRGSMPARALGGGASSGSRRASEQAAPAGLGWEQETKKRRAETAGRCREANVAIPLEGTCSEQIKSVG